MKNFFAFLLFAIFFFSCESTQEPKKEIEFQLIGTVNFCLKNYTSYSQLTGEFNCGFYLSGIKIELISNGQVIETTYPVSDSSCDMFYLLKEVEFGKPYIIRMTINDEMIDSTDEFTILEKDVKNSANDTTLAKLSESLSWFEDGNYYSDFVFNTEKFKFDYYTHPELLNVFPNPIITSGNIEYYINTPSSIEININNIDKSFNIIAFRGFVEQGKYILQFGDSLEDGLYFVKMIGGGQTVYCPFLKGKKGAPPMP